jgi:hypothetical protein
MKPNPKIVAAFTHADDNRWLPPGVVVGELEVRHVPALNCDQYLVDGSGVDETTLAPLAHPTPKLLRALKEKSLEWARYDQLLARGRARKDESFREESVDKDFEVYRVREDRWEAFSAFCDGMRRENQRLTAERQAEVADLVRKHQRKAR